MPSNLYFFETLAIFKRFGALQTEPKSSKNQKKYEKLYRKDYKYDLIIPVKYNWKKNILNKGSCIFLHLTKTYKPTAGCIALEKKDFLIMLKLINKRTKIKIC